MKTQSGFSLAFLIVLLTGLVVGTLLGLALSEKHDTRPEAAAPPGVTIVSSAREPTRIPLPNGEVLVVPAGQTARVSITQEGDSDRSSVGGLHERGAAASLGATAKGRDLQQNLDLETPEIAFGQGFFAKAGGAEYSLTSLTKSGGGWLLVVGCLLIVAGIVVWIWLKQATIGLALIASGVVLLGVAYLYQSHPWILALAALAILGVIVVIFVLAKQKQTATTAVTAIVKGIEAAGQIEPKDLTMTIPVEQVPFAQEVINATIAALKARVQAASEKTGGTVAAFVAKIT
jgi:lipoprotein signal peptidase